MNARPCEGPKAISSALSLMRLKGLSVIAVAILLVAAEHSPARGAAGDVPEDKSAFTIGLLQGSSLIGADYERLVADRIGIQIGAGIVGFDAGVTYHYRPGIRSRHFYLGFWNVGVPGDQWNLQVLGLTHVWRSRRAFTAQLGIGARLSIGDEGRDRFGDSPVVLLYSIGLCGTPGK